LNEKSAIEVANDYRDNFGCCIIVPDLSCLIKGGRLAKTQDGTSGSDVPALVSLDRNGNKFLNKSTDVEKIFEIMETYFKTVITDFSFSKVEKICVLQATHTGKNFNGKIYEEQFKKTFAERLPTGVIVEKQSLPGVIIAHIGPDYYAVALKIKK
jgi:fatty acid-binding protein DegV